MASKKQEKPKVPQHYILKVEGIAPVIAEYRVLAIDEDDALEQFKKGKIVRQEAPIRILPHQIKPKKISVRDQLTGLINRIKNFL